MVINAENYHALELFNYAYEGQVDAIYIDPPYNTGARDWKYNNDYVDDNDRFRHSKWLSFMEKRLQLAKRLLNPDDSVLIVTIDEKEYLRLGLLLEQVFPEDRIQMVSVGINPAAVARAGYFGRSDEYYFFVMRGVAGVRALALGEDWITTRGRTHRGEIRWDLLRKSGSSPTREGHPETFYPFFLSQDGSKITGIGECLRSGGDRVEVTPPEGSFAVWPIRRDGSEGRWRLKPSSIKELVKGGFVKLGVPKGETTPVYYLAKGERRKIAEGVYNVEGKREDGSVITSTIEDPVRVAVPGTQWLIAAHDATQYGTRLVRKLMPDRSFNFPKSLYAVEDALRFFVTHKPHALVLDFFAGSGTTAHAVARLNRQDGGSRRSIIVTNNEVSAEEARMLHGAGLRPGDAEWEALGIFEHITRPRVTAAITGRTPDGRPIAGDYGFADETPMADGFEENVHFVRLTYLDRNDVDRGKAFESIAPLLWMRAGSVGEMIATETVTFAAPERARYAVLFNVSYGQEFLDTIAGRDDLEHVYVVTDSQAQYQQIVTDLPSGVGVSMLYEEYLRNFELNTGDLS